MSKLKIHKMIVGPVQTNCYLVYNEESKETLIIDPGDQADRIREQIRIHQLCPCAILLTHGHFDHIMAAEELRREYDLPVYAGEEERTLTGDPSMNASREFGVSCAVTIDRGLSDGQQLSLAGFSIRVIHTPG
ncbi:MAG: MBL fold metallo-hydrolase, partial [Lachnospiraceae bacterium]